VDTSAAASETSSTDSSVKAGTGGPLMLSEMVSKPKAAAA